MNFKNKNLSPQERYNLIGKLIEEIKLRKYSFQTGKTYISVVTHIFMTKNTPLSHHPPNKK